MHLAYETGYARRLAGSGSWTRPRPLVGGCAARLKPGTDRLTGRGPTPDQPGRESLELETLIGTHVDYSDAPSVL